LPVAKNKQAVGLSKIEFNGPEPLRTYNGSVQQRSGEYFADDQHYAACSGWQSLVLTQAGKL